MSATAKKFPWSALSCPTCTAWKPVIDVLVEKGLVTKEEVLKRIEKVVEERGKS